MSRISILWLLLFPSLFASILLAADEPVRVDQYGDPLPPGALARLGTVRFRQGTQIHSLAYSPDGKLIASGGNDGRIVLWDAQSGKRNREIQATPATVATLAFSLDGKRLVSVNELARGRSLHGHEEIWVWEVSTGKKVQRLEPEGWTSALALSPDGKIIARTDNSDFIRLWDLRKQDSAPYLESETSGGNKQRNFVFAPDEKTLAVAEPDGRIRFWNVQTGEMPRSEIELPEQPEALAYARDGGTLAVVGADGVRRYRMADLQEIHRIRLKKEYLSRDTAFLADGQTLVGRGEDGTVRFWDVKSGELRRELPNQSDKYLFAVPLDGRMLANVDVGMSTPWGTTNGGVINVWDTHTGRPQVPMTGHLGRVKQVAFLRDQQSVVSYWGDKSHLAVWPAGTGKDTRPMGLPRDAAQVKLSPDGSSVVVLTQEGVLVVLDVPSGRERVRCAVGKNKPLQAISIETMCAAISTEDRRSVEIWGLRTQNVLKQIGLNVDCTALSPDGRRAAMKTDDAECSIWDLDKMNEACRFDGIFFGFSYVAFSPDSRTIACYHQYQHSMKGERKHSIQLREVATGCVRLELEGPPEYVRQLAFAPDGRTLASGGTGKAVRLWDLTDGKELHAFTGHFGFVESVAFSADGSKLVSGSTDATALVWDVPKQFRNRRLPALALGTQEQSDLWAKLASSDAAAAYEALQRLARSPAAAAALCQARLLPLPRAKPEQIQRWIRQLDDEEYAVREQASRNLEGIEAEAEAALAAALKAKCSPEAQWRIEALLETVQRKHPHLRILRTVELLEQIGTPEAVEVLRQVEKKTGDAAVREDVRRSLGRLAAIGKAR